MPLIVHIFGTSELHYRDMRFLKQFPLGFYMVPAPCGRFMQYTVFNFCNLTQYYKKWDDFMCMNIDSVLDDIMSVESLSLLGPDF